MEIPKSLAEILRSLVETTSNLVGTPKLQAAQVLEQVQAVVQVLALVLVQVVALEQAVARVVALVAVQVAAQVQVVEQALAVAAAQVALEQAQNLALAVGQDQAPVLAVNQGLEQVQKQLLLLKLPLHPKLLLFLR